MGLEWDIRYYVISWSIIFRVTCTRSKLLHAPVSSDVHPFLSPCAARDPRIAAALSPSCYPGVNAAVVLGVVMVVAFAVPAMWWIRRGRCSAVLLLIFWRTHSIRLVCSYCQIPNIGIFDAYAQMVNMFYFTPYVMALLGIVILVMTIWQRHGRDREAAEERNEYSNDSEIWRP